MYIHTHIYTRPVLNELKQHIKNHIRRKSHFKNMHVRQKLIHLSNHVISRQFEQQRNTPQPATIDFACQISSKVSCQISSKVSYMRYA